MVLLAVEAAVKRGGGGVGGAVSLRCADVSENASRKSMLFYCRLLSMAGCEPQCALPLFFQSPVIPKAGVVKPDINSFFFEVGLRYDGGLFYAHKRMVGNSWRAVELLK